MCSVPKYGKRHSRYILMISMVTLSCDVSDEFMAPIDTYYHGGTLTVVLVECGANCAETAPTVMGTRFTVSGQTSHVDPLDGWHCSPSKRTMSSRIQVRQ